MCNPIFSLCVHMKAMCGEMVTIGAHTTNVDMIVDFHKFL